MSGDHNQYQKPDGKCRRCGEVNPAYIHTCTPKREEGCAECGKKASEGWALYCVKCSEPVREWQGLTDDEIKHLWYEACQTNLELTSQLIVHLARNIEAKLKEKNGG